MLNTIRNLYVSYYIMWCYQLNQITNQNILLYTIALLFIKE